MTQNLRVKSSEFIDETNRISFKFDGKTYYGFKGDTLASALIANNVHFCLLYTSPSPRDATLSRMPSSA